MGIPFLVPSFTLVLNCTNMRYLWQGPGKNEPNESVIFAVRIKKGVWSLAVNTILLSRR